LPDAWLDALEDAWLDALQDAWLDALEDALDPGFHGVRTPWIRGFMAFQLARRRGNYPISARFGHPVFDGKDGGLT
jgi:hypothetical protein